MSNQTPIEKIITDPRFADKAAQKIQIVLRDELPWLETSFGRARVGKKSDGEATVTYPEVQQTFGTDYVSAMPNDNVLSQCYILIQNEVADEVAEGEDMVNWVADCAIVFFIRDLNEIDTSYSSNIEQLLRRDIQKALAERAGNFTITGFSDEYEEAYSEFSEPIKSQFINDHKKYAYLRFDGQIDFKTPCTTAFPYDGNFDFDPLQNYDFIYGGTTFIQQP